MIILVLIGILILMVIVSHLVEYFKIRKTLGKLTGKYRHKKSPKGTMVEVETSQKGVRTFRKATTKDIAILKQINYLK